MKLEKGEEEVVCQHCNGLCFTLEEDGSDTTGTEIDCEFCNH